MIKPEWHEAINQIQYKNWKYNLVGAIDGDYLQITFYADPGDDFYEVTKQFARKWRLENGYTVSDIIKVAFMATLAAEEHEAREEFKYKGVSVFGPHLDVDALVDLAKKKANLDLREEVMA